MDQEAPRSESADLDGGVTRRKVLTGAGLALAGGLAGGVAAATVGPSAVGATVGGIATGPAQLQRSRLSHGRDRPRQRAPVHGLTP